VKPSNHDRKQLELAVAANRFQEAADELFRLTRKQKACRADLLEVRALLDEWLELFGVEEDQQT